MSESSLGFGRLSRRTALKGLGCTLGLPLLEAMLPGTGYAAEHFGGKKEDYDAIKHHSAVGSTGQPNQ